MILATIQPSFLPWLGYLEQVALADRFVYLDDVSYTKQDWRNRNRILNLAGEPEYLTVPVRAGADQLPIKDVAIADDVAWKRRLISKLAACYRRAPHAERYLPLVADIILRQHDRLVDLNYALMAVLTEAYGIGTPTVLASKAKIGAVDKNQRLIDLCLHHGADILYDGAAAASFIDEARFAAAGVRVVFQHYQPVAYAQGPHPFVSHLSALDALLWCGPRAGEILRASPAPRGLGRVS